MTTLPDHFEDYDHYREWLDETVETEIDEFLDWYEDEIEEHGYVAHEALHNWIVESPQFERGQDEYVRLYDDVDQHADAPIPDMEIVIPAENPWHKIAQAVRFTLVEDARCRAQEILEQRGYDVE